MAKRKIVLLDNNDSFTYNIVDYLRGMTEVQFRVINTHELDIEELDKYDGIIISPGPELPKDFPKLFEVLQRYHRTKPILGICLGHQAIAQFFGADLSQQLPVVHGQAVPMQVLRDDSLFSGLPREFRVGLYHSWLVDPKTIPARLVVTALSARGVIMAIRVTDLPIWGIQFHPESHITEHGLKILENFIKLT
ncbi:anthranilate synthase component II [Desulfotalea psychrophila]|uniref:Probable para-aminobenzoate/anthranilate synthase glutamine amidotransferase, component II n=1 Tax=Desulfotalea psychrophila (strain LSv54 / DSM 12343) TaxID=177439 RepID=Q6APW7_DESPS|nr:aminodeoxychorismate/anthranilate synthase component II [Desulfotalea psychrophila]CAG35606.1 probable para-aminobenzoate/anthranilate synthase glutamine amidotransferase, component II [Desulfotalea psychrophila LSv54]